jgi:Flp pilus assembly protein TadG
MSRLLHAFARNQKGAATIEFAFVVPVFLIICLGMFEAAGVVSANMKLENAAQLMANLVAQQSNETNSMTSNFCTGAQYAMEPLSGTPLKADVVSVTNSSGTDTVNWQDTTCGSASTVSNGSSIASSLIPNSGDSVIVVVATYTYTSPLSYVLKSSYTLTQTTYSRPRNVTSITHS